MAIEGSWRIFVKVAQLRISAITFLLACASPAWDGTNPGGAAKIGKALEPYFGSAAPDNIPIFRVAPKGHAYTLTFELRRFQAPPVQVGMKFS